MPKHIQHLKIQMNRNLVFWLDESTLAVFNQAVFFILQFSWDLILKS